MDNEIVKCGYKYCSHTNKDIVKSEAMQTGKSTYYHLDCYKQNEEIKEIIDLFQKQIDPLVVFTQLRGVINNIVFDKCLGSEYLLFALKYAISNKINLKHAQGLHYIVGYKNIQDAYLKEKNKQQIEQKGRVEIIKTEELPFFFNPTKQKGFQDIIKE
jgi:hypothetical protein